MAKCSRGAKSESAAKQQDGAPAAQTRRRLLAVLTAALQRLDAATLEKKPKQLMALMMLEQHPNLDEKTQKRVKFTTSNERTKAK